MARLGVRVGFQGFGARDGGVWCPPRRKTGNVAYPACCDCHEAPARCLLAPPKAHKHAPPPNATGPRLTEPSQQAQPPSRQTGSPHRIRPVSGVMGSLATSSAMRASRTMRFVAHVSSSSSSRRQPSSKASWRAAGGRGTGRRVLRGARASLSRARPRAGGGGGFCGFPDSVPRARASVPKKLERAQTVCGATTHRRAAAPVCWRPARSSRWRRRSGTPRCRGRLGGRR